MFTIFNSESLWIGTDLKRFNEDVYKRQELISTGRVTGIITTDYICNPDNMKLRLSKHMSEIEAADAVLVFSCGVGVQTISAYLEDKTVYAACDTYPLPDVYKRQPFIRAEPLTDFWCLTKRQFP